MSAVEALQVARAVGVIVGVDGDDLLLSASAPPPPAVVEALSRHKAGIVELLRSANHGWTAEDWQEFFDERAGILEYDCGLLRPAAEAEAFQNCVVAWLNHYPAVSPAGRCAWCGYPDSRDVVVLPFGTGPHIWLHGKCWSSWHLERQAKAAAALASMGVGPRGTP